MSGMEEWRNGGELTEKRKTTGKRGIRAKLTEAGGSHGRVAHGISGGAGQRASASSSESPSFTKASRMGLQRDRSVATRDRSVARLDRSGLT